MQLFTIIIFVVLIATDGNLIAIGVAINGIIFYFFGLVNNKKGRTNAKQNKVVGIVHWEQWITTSSENSEFITLGIAKPWQLADMSADERDNIEKSMKVFAAKPIPVTLENVHSLTTPTTPQADSEEYPNGDEKDESTSN